MNFVLSTLFVSTADSNRVDASYYTPEGIQMFLIWYCASIKKRYEI
jgi:hypothetical protein